LSDLQQDLDEILDDASVGGTTQSVLVVDLDSGQLVYERNPEDKLKPASNTKLYTSAAAMDLLGADHRFHTEVVSAAPISAKGVLNSALILVGDHDFTWSTYVLDDANWPLEQLVDQLYEAGLREARGGVAVRGEVLLDGYRFGSYAASTQRSIVADELEALLSKRGIVVSGTASADVVEGEATLASWKSPTIAVSTVPLNRVSHNEFADVLARHLAQQLGGTSSYQTWGEEVRSWLSLRGLDADVLLHDGSGLSHDNRVSASAVVELITYMVESSQGQRWLRSLSIAGVSGTLANRLGGADTEGRVFAKTGTLTGAIATSGLLINRHDERRYAFSILMNDTVVASDARAVQDRLIARLAEDLRGGQAPPVPDLARVARRDESLVELSWAPVPEAQGYLVWFSEDGRSWSRDRARFVTSTEFVADDLPGTIYARVSARVGAIESKTSDVYAASRGGGSRILLVDANDRWQDGSVWENTLGASHDFVVDHGAALGARTFDSVANEIVAQDSSILEDYDLVVWIAGEEGAEHLAFAPEEQVVVANFVDAGGRLLVSGSEIGWQLVENGSAEDQQFFASVLGAEYVGDDAGAYYVRDDSKVFGFHSPGEQEVSYPDQVRAGDGAEVLLTYANGSTEAAAIGIAEQVVYMAFPFESVDGAEAQGELMTRLLGFLL
jgi:D-alanyl-D-alanine carboxypeptidase